MTVAENIVLAVEPTKGPLLDRGEAAARVKAISDRYGLAVNPEALVEDVTVGMQQRVEILKALYRGADILILDEPTAVLTPQEATELVGILRNLTAQGTSVIFITHKLNEVLDIADRVTVLRRGKYIGTETTEGATGGDPRQADGGARGRPDGSTRPRRSPAQPRLEVRDLVVHDDRGPGGRPRPVAWRSGPGEIVGLAGVDGNGQAELIDAIAGLRAPTSGTILVDGQDITGASPHDVLEAGCGHIPTDRQHRGLVMEFSLAENIALHDFDKPPSSSHGWLFPRRMEAAARAAADASSTSAAAGREGPPPRRSPAATSRR